MQQDIPETKASRAVGPALAIGILALPVIFVWFLLPHGYSERSRLIGFGWLACTMLIVLASRLPPDAPEKAKAQASPVTQTETAIAVAAPSSDGDKLKIAPEPSLSPAAKQMLALYEELDGFRSDVEFAKVGYNPCCRYHDWKRRVVALGQKSGPALMQELRVSPGELVQLGLEYMKSGGRPTRLSEDIHSRVAHALKPVVPKTGGGGRTLGVGYWCKDIETQFSSLRAIEAGNFGMADQIKSETACPKVVAGVTTGPELDRRHYTFSGGKTRAEFVKVRLNDGRQLWISMDEIEFR